MSERQDRLAERIERIRARRSERGPSDRWMLLVGGLLLPLGIALVVLGWVGVSHTVYLYDQLTYLASGSALGLALVIVGGFVYFTYWQTVRVREARAQHEESQQVLLRIEALLGKGSLPLTGLVATSTGDQVHRAGCAAVRDRTDLRPVSDDTDLAPCRLCDPLPA
jgi:type II secretory pathway component PulM